MGAVEVEAAGSVLRAAGGSEEPLSISDTGDKTWICCWEEATSLCFTFFKRLHFNTNCCSCFLALGYKILQYSPTDPTMSPDISQHPVFVHASPLEDKHFSSLCQFS